jgi:hypothetical protein
MSAVALTGTALLIARAAAIAAAVAELAVSLQQASAVVQNAQAQNRDPTPEEIAGLFQTDNADLAALHVAIAAKVAAPGAAPVG